MPLELLRELLPEVQGAVATIGKVVDSLVSAAYLDPVAQILNGAALRRFEDVKERAHTFGAVFVDLTGFKRINDEHGHEAGDAALRESATVLEGIGREFKAYVFRKSGDEFVLLTKSHDDARQCANAIVARFRDGLQFTYSGATLAVRAAVGFSLRQDAEATLPVLVNQADEACRDAKDRGSGEAVEWQPGHPGDELVSERKRCSQCGATTSLMVRKTKRETGALSSCANCHQPL